MKIKYIAFLFLCFSAFSCQTSDLEKDLEDIEKIPLPANSKYLALGDSYTFGQGIDASGRWPEHLSQMLSQEKIEIGEPLVIARTGWTSGDLLKHLRTVYLPTDYSMVSLQIGVNDQYQNLNITDFRNNLRTLLAMSTTFAQKNPKNVFVLTIPDWGATPAGNGRNKAAISLQIKNFNDVIYDEAAKAGIAVGNVYDLSLLVVIEPDLVAPDGLHYSSQMYQQWAQRVLPITKAILQE